MATKVKLSWNEIRTRAIAFSKNWEKESSERAEAQTFWNEFFDVYGVDRKRVASFEKAVKKANGADGRIDVFWKGQIMVEHKSLGRDLDSAFGQAIDYFPGLKDEELPKYVVVSDFARFRVKNMETEEITEFALAEFPENIHLFGFMAGYISKKYKDGDQVNIKAAEKMGRLHDRLKEIGYDGHALEVYLVRLLFIMFAEDTGIFDKNLFLDYLENHTKEDGSDLAMHLSQLFHVLNTPPEKRLKTLDESLAAFAYINGRLFEETLPPAAFDRKMRETLIESCYMDWAPISPAIFGSLFQSVMDPKERRNLGAHYTSEKNIMKLIGPLFLDELKEEFEKVKKITSKLDEFHRKLAKIKFLDPACGCGNFLIITYRELRLLEIEVLKVKFKNQQVTDIEALVYVDVDQAYGIEYDEFPSRIAEVAMWLIDHQMNDLTSRTFGNFRPRIPLKKSAKIVHGNALKLDWNYLIPGKSYLNISADELNIIAEDEPAHYGTVNVRAKKVNRLTEDEAGEQLKGYSSRFDYILGNPPFLGKQFQNEAQKADIQQIFGKLKGAGNLDYVACWFKKAAEYLQNGQTKAAFVSTNSISQGEQTAVLWGLLFQQYRIKIHFAHRTFQWSNKAKGNAAVHCVIVGFAAFDIPSKRLFDYENIKGEASEMTVKNINPYLSEGADTVVLARSFPLTDVPEIAFGSMPNDGGFLIFSDEEKQQIEQNDPEIIRFIRPFLGAYEFINKVNRWCLWLKNVNPTEIKKSPETLKRVEAVKKYRLASKRAATRKLAGFPGLFGEIRQPEACYILIPSTSSERRKYIPIGFVSENVIASNACLTISSDSKYVFGIVCSAMHMNWLSHVGGRLKSDYRYSNKLVYNTFPWPKNPAAKHIKKVENCAQKVLDVREQYLESSLADLYDPLLMPADLVKAHNALDKAVDLCYRPQPFPNEASRIAFLFELYTEYTNPLQGAVIEQVKEEKRAKRRKKKDD